MHATDTRDATVGLPETGIGMGELGMLAVKVLGKFVVVRRYLRRLRTVRGRSCSVS
jgi:hypothetical protein